MSRPVDPGGSFNDFPIPAKDELGDYIRAVGDARFASKNETSALAAALDEAQSFAHSGAGAGAVTRSKDAKLREWISVKDFGAVGNGTADDTVPIENATNFANGRAVFFPAGIYRVTRTLALTVQKYRWVGEKNEMGTQSRQPTTPSALLTNQTTRINFVPTDTTQYMVSRHYLGGVGVIGPFAHENLSFDFGAANGFQFGDEATHTGIGEGTGPGGQSYIFGLRFKDCDLRADYNITQDSEGRYVRTGRKLLHMTKCFEAVLDGLSLVGGDEQVRCWGCDRPKFTNIRSQRGAIPLHLISAGSFTVQHSVENLEVEGWIFSPVITRGVRFSGVNLSFENVDRPPGGKQNLSTLFGYTAAVTAGSGTITFSADMTNVLHPGLSIIKLEDSGNEFHALVETVSGSTVTYATANNKLTWSAAAATVTRYHGYGPLQYGAMSAAYSNVTCGADKDCPAFVYHSGRGSMLIANAFAEAGGYGDIRSLVIGNVPDSNAYMSSGMRLTTSTPLIWPDPAHPLVRIADADYAGASVEPGNSSRRAPLGSAVEALSRVNRFWAFTPKRSAHTSGGWHKTPVVPVAGDAGTEQKVWAWLLSNGVQFGLVDGSLPSVVPVGSVVRVSVRARARTGSASLAVVAAGNGGANIGNLTFGSAWETQRLTVSLPTQWTGARGTTPGFLLTATGDDLLLDAVLVEEVAQYQDAVAGSDGGAVRQRAGRAVGTSGSPMALITLPLASYTDGKGIACKLKLFVSSNNSGVRAYANCQAEFAFFVANPVGDTADLVSDVAQVFKHAKSVNASVLAVDASASLALSGGNIVVQATASVAGTSSATNTAVDALWVLEILDDNALAVIA